VEDVIIARWVLTGPGPDRSLGELTTQLSALYYSAFTCSAQRRTTAEMEACNAVRSRALTTELWPTSFRDLPITLFMLCATNAHSPSSLALETPAGRDRLCSNFFVNIVPEHELQRYVTPDQRRALCQFTEDKWKGRLSLLQSWLLNCDAKLPARFADLDDSNLMAFVRWYREVGVWDNGLDYTLPEDELRACQMTLAPNAGGFELVIPPYFAAKELLPHGMTSTETEDWLREMVRARRYETMLPWRLFDPSIFTYISGNSSVPDVRSRTTLSNRKLGVRRLVQEIW